jgi:hypothetical protein
MAQSYQIVPEGINDIPKLFFGPKSKQIRECQSAFFDPARNPMRFS